MSPNRRMTTFISLVKSRYRARRRVLQGYPPNYAFPGLSLGRSDFTKTTFSVLNARTNGRQAMQVFANEEGL
jgi:hypothetical protein